MQSNLVSTPTQKIILINLHILVYQFCFSGCSKSYIGKMERIFFERVNEHAFKDKNSVVYNHINNCDEVKYLVNLLNVDQVQTKHNMINLKRKYMVWQLLMNMNIVDRVK